MSEEQQTYQSDIEWSDYYLESKNLDVLTDDEVYVFVEKVGKYCDDGGMTIDNARWLAIKEVLGDRQD